MARKKRFDKKSSITFKLVHRSQRDPLIADERAPQHVLVPISGVSGETQTRANQTIDENTEEDRLNEQRKYGIYFDDEYNYLQHLRDVNYLNEWQQIDYKKQDKNQSKTNSNKLQFPSSLFASNVEEKEGLLNKGVLPVGPQPDWDPDLVAAMDQDFDFDDPNNQIDDDFIQQAEGEDLSDEDEDNQWEDMTDSEDGTEESDEEDVSTVCGDDRSQTNDRNHLFADEETKSQFTNYSMTSSVIRRNKNLTILDERFETLYEREYANDCDIGALDFDEIEGHIDPNNSELMTKLVEEYEEAKNYKEVYENVDSKSFLNYYNKDSKNSEELTEIEIYENSKKGDKDRFDCESIISTYSNLYNHPKLIKESDTYPKRLRINEKTGLPIGVLDKPGLTAKKLAKLDAMNNVKDDFSKTGSKSVRSTASRLSVLSMRSKDENPAERKLRKSALKEYRRERRLEKKANKIAFKSEELRMNKEVINLQKSLNGVKLC